MCNYFHLQLHLLVLFMVQQKYFFCGYQLNVEFGSVNPLRFCDTLTRPFSVYIKKTTTENNSVLGNSLFNSRTPHFCFTTIHSFAIPSLPPKPRGVHGTKGGFMKLTVCFMKPLLFHETFFFFGR